MFNWLKKGIKNTSEKIVDNGKKLFGSETIVETSIEIKNMAKKTLSPKEAIKNAKKETFIEAIKRQKITDLELLQIYKNYVTIFYISIGFAIFLFIFLIYKLFIKNEILDSISVLVFFIFCLVNAFKYSFRSFQIKHQKLCAVKEWWDRPNEWFPSLK
jgi:hypothetical protein